MNSVLYGRHLTLVVLTVATQAAVGISIFRALRYIIGSGHGSIIELFILFLLGLSGAVVSVFHLGHPERMYTALKNPWSSWLSREGIVLSLFMGTAFFQMAFGFSHTITSGMVLALIGLGLVFIQAMVYVVPGYSAMRHGAPVIFFFFSSLTTGICLSTWFGDEAWRQTLTQLALIIFSSGLLLVLILPWTWRLGSAVVSDTAKAWCRSPFYYLWIGLGFIVPLLVLSIFKTLPLWLPIFVIAAECMGRVLFFTETRHSSDYIGIL